MAILYIPHSSTVIPTDMRTRVLLYDAELGQELRNMTDWYTDDVLLLPVEIGVTVRFPVSRSIVDPERFPDDEPEWLRELARGSFESGGFKVAINRPCGGTIVPTAHYRRERAVMSVMIERLQTAPLGAAGSDIRLA